jgi:hypothetical protein
MGVPTDMIGFAQEIGRLSRDQQGGFSRVLLPQGWRGGGLPSVVDQRRTAVSEMAMLVYLGDNRCLSAVLSRFLDGAERMQYCQAEDPKMRCSKCEQFGLFHAEHETDHTVWWDAASGSGQVDESEEEERDEQDEQDERDEGMGAWVSEVEVHGGEVSIELDAGGQRLRDSMREEAIGRGRYEERLQMFHGRCMICMMLGQGRIPIAEQWHEFQACRHIQRRQFVQAKQEAIQRNQTRGGWLKRYVACFRCGQPQDICPVGEQRSHQACMFRDMVLPAAWALFRRDNRWGRTMGEITGAASAVWESEARWMDWLGTECDLYGMRACQAARIMDVIMSLEVGESRRTEVLPSED